jgi:hypothetical protein
MNELPNSRRNKLLAIRCRLIKLDIPIATANKLVECLVNIGIVFIP